MMFLSNWLNQFGKVKKFPIACEFLTGSDVYVSQSSKIVTSLQQGGVVVSRLWYGCWHYVLLTGADESYIYLFDPYYRKNPFHIKGIDMMSDAPAKMNRKVAYDLMNGTGKGTYAFGPKDTREAMVMFNRNTQKTPFKTIEYFI